MTKFIDKNQQSRQRKERKEYRQRGREIESEGFFHLIQKFIIFILVYFKIVILYY